MVRYGCSAFAAFAISPIFYHSSWLSLLWRRYPDAIACQKCPLTCHLVVAFTLQDDVPCHPACLGTYILHTHTGVLCTHRHTYSLHPHTGVTYVSHSQASAPRSLLTFGTKSQW